MDLSAAAREADGVVRQLEQVQEVLLVLFHGGDPVGVGLTLSIRRLAGRKPRGEETGAAEEDAGGALRWISPEAPLKHLRTR